MTAQLSELRKTVTVRPGPRVAFELFTDRMGAWWPLETHSVGHGGSRDVVVEHGVGGHLVETLADGSTCVWGTVEVWEPPARLRFTWHPGRPEGEATLVEVTFRAASDGTVVELVHTGWDRRSDGVSARSSYDGGWDLVLGRYATSAG